jgi:hypothetical protein
MVRRVVFGEPTPRPFCLKNFSEPLRVILHENENAGGQWKTARNQTDKTQAGKHSARSKAYSSYKEAFWTHQGQGFGSDCEYPT